MLNSSLTQSWWLSWHMQLTNDPWLLQVYHGWLFHLQTWRGWCYRVPIAIMRNLSSIKGLWYDMIWPGAAPNFSQCFSETWNMVDQQDSNLATPIHHSFRPVNNNFSTSHHLTPSSWWDFGTLPASCHLKTEPTYWDRSVRMLCKHSHRGSERIGSKMKQLTQKNSWL